MFSPTQTTTTATTIACHFELNTTLKTILKFQTLTATAYNSSFKGDMIRLGPRRPACFLWRVSSQIGTLSAGTRSSRGGASGARSGASLSASDILHSMPQAWQQTGWAGCRWGKKETEQKPFDETRLDYGQREGEAPTETATWAAQTFTTDGRPDGWVPGERCCSSAALWKVFLLLCGSLESFPSPSLTSAHVRRRVFWLFSA